VVSFNSGYSVGQAYVLAVAAEAVCTRPKEGEKLMKWEYLATSTCHICVSHNVTLTDRCGKKMKLLHSSCSYWYAYAYNSTL